MNKEIFEKNIECIKKKFPRLFKQLERYEKDDGRPDDRIDVEVVQGKRGFPTFAFTNREGKRVFGHSVFDPIKDAEKKLSHFSFDDRERIVLLGFGFGYEARHIINNMEHPIVVILEPFISVFRKAIENVDITDIITSGKIALSFTLNPNDMKYILTTMSTHVMIPEYKSHLLPYLSEYPEMIESVKKAIKEVEKFYGFNIATGAYAGSKIQNNLALNFSAARRHPGVNRLAQQFKNKPVFVVAPGPSLEKNVKQLKRVKGKALIICCDTSTRPMLRNGVEPDIIMTIDYQPANYFKLRGVDTSFAYLVPALDVYPHVVLNHRGRMFGYYHRNETEMMFGPILGGKGIVSTGGSVLTDCFNLARYVGADPIILMGVDLGFPGMKWYASGSFDEGESTKMLESGEQNILEVEDIYGNLMPTYCSFAEFISWFNISIPNQDDTVIDATEGGARLDDTIIMDASEAIDKYVEGHEVPVSEILEASYKSFIPIPSEQILAGLDDIIESFKNIADPMEKGLKNCRKAIRLLETSALSNNKELIRLLKKINDAKEILNSAEKESSLNFLGPMMERQMALVYHAKNDDSLPRNEQYKKMVELDRDFYRQIFRASKNMVTHFEIMRQELLLEGDEEFV